MVLGCTCGGVPLCGTAEKILKSHNGFLFRFFCSKEMNYNEMEDICNLLFRVCQQLKERMS